MLPVLLFSSAHGRHLRWGGGGGGGGGGGNNVRVVSQLNDKEEKDLLFMREEEKMARDVYITLYKKWNVRVFHNIEKSEQNHMDRMLDMINLYSLEDPVRQQC